MGQMKRWLLDLGRLEVQARVNHVAAACAAGDRRHPDRGNSYPSPQQLRSHVSRQQFRAAAATIPKLDS